MSQIFSSLVRLVSQKRMANGVRKMASLPRVSQESKGLPKGVSLVTIDSAHDVPRMRKHLANVFSSSREPLTEGLFRYYYPNVVSAAEKLQIVEEKSKIFFSENELAQIIGEGFSLVAVTDDKPDEYVSVLFVERYKGKHYTFSEDPFCRAIYNLLRSLHQKTAPILTTFAHDSIAYLSHGATSDEYRTTGIMGVVLEFALSNLAENGFQVAFMFLSSDRHARFAMDHHGFHIAAEIKLMDYEDGGQKPFANFSDGPSSIKSMVKFL